MAMIVRFKKCLVVLVLCSIVTPSFAQENPEAKTAANGPRKQMATIIFAGLAGAVLGLSTLSFYGRPQDRLSNIAIGFAIGVIGGTIYVTYGAATKPREFYGETHEDPTEGSSRQALLDSQFQQTQQLGFSFRF